MTAPHRQSILLIGATGRAGLEILNQLISNPSRPYIHVFCRNPSKLAPEYHKVCTSVYQGDARSASDIEEALATTEADLVIVAVGNGDNLGMSDIRTANAQAVASAMSSPGMEHVRAIVLSSTGAGASQIKVGMGFGKLIEYRLRNVLTDHTGQEAAFSDLADRTVIVRPTALTDGKANGKIIEFGDKQKSPSIHIDRGDVAVYIAEAACDGTVGGRIVNITGKK